MKKGLTTICILVLALLYASYLYDSRVLPKWNLNDYVKQHGGNIAGFREWSKVYPSYQDVSNYLTDATLIISSQFDNEIVFSGNNKSLIVWYGSQISEGYWTSNGMLQRISWNDDSKWVVVQKFCTHFSEEESQGLCIIVDSVASILANGKNVQRIPGNVFDLQSGRSPPARLPRGPLDYHSVQALIESQSNYSGQLK